ncbi:MIA40 [Candida jiufengensis]|uniref:MIA40 n=1 Tax=Candida jiufengensis TaxID=497108 RepID=UPI002224A31E|nr:MIA40 [Candida jiufengensis]KAI5953612.1 MIA40 [Candida jiufengensis]
MYRQFTKSSIARQASRITRSYSTNASTTSSKYNSKLIIGSIVPIAVAIGYYSLNNSKIYNLSSPVKVAEAIREEFKEGNIMADDQEELFHKEQKRLAKEQDEEELKQKEDIKKQTTKDAKGTDSKDIATDSQIRKQASNDLNDDTTRHAASDPRNKQEKPSDQASASIKEGGKKSSNPTPKETSSDTAQADADNNNNEEKEPKQEAAYNPETGEINWDCPCLGGMAHGPCGEEFKEAFSCFVFSETEPKGIDCIKKFENMRSCFKKYPDHYKEELYDDDDKEYDVETVEHIVLETADPAVEQIETGLDEGKLKNPEK